MMKVLHVIDSMDMGGAQSLIAELAPAQKEQGVEVTVLQFPLKTKICQEYIQYLCFDALFKEVRRCSCSFVPCELLGSIGKDVQF